MLKFHRTKRRIIMYFEGYVDWLFYEDQAFADFEASLNYDNVIDRETLERFRVSIKEDLEAGIRQIDFDLKSDDELLEHVIDVMGSGVYIADDLLLGRFFTQYDHLQPLEALTQDLRPVHHMAGALDFKRSI
jgi:hypothetical protein